MFEIFTILLILLTLTITAMILYLKTGFIKAQDVKIKETPSVTIIVSMHNEEKNVNDCLQCLLRQNYPKEKTEIVIVNDRSDDQTGGILTRYQQQYSNIHLITIHELQENFAPKKYAIDQAIHHSNGDIILLTDADGRPGRGWAETIVSHFSPSVGMVIGYAPYTTEPPFNRLRYRLMSMEYLSHAAVAAASTNLGFPLTCVGTNMAYRKEVYLQLRGFGRFKALRSGDDDLFMQRVRQETTWQIKYAYEATAHVNNFPPRYWWHFYQQRLRYASKGFVYPLPVTIGLILYFLYNLFLSLSLIAAFFIPEYWLLVSVILLLKGLIEYAFLKKAKKFLDDPRPLVLFPVAFILHIPYVVTFALLTQIINFQWGSLQSDKKLKKSKS